MTRYRKVEMKKIPVKLDDEAYGGRSMIDVKGDWLNVTRSSLLISDLSDRTSARPSLTVGR